MNDPSVTAAFVAAIAELGEIHARIAGLTQDPADGWRRELIAQRRLLQAKIGEISLLLGRHSDENIAHPLREAMNRMRSKVALHQANWPAVKIELADPQYRASIRDMRAANREFSELAERLLGT